MAKTRLIKLLRKLRLMLLLQMCCALPCEVFHGILPRCLG